MGRDACGNWQGICGPFCNDDTNERGLRLLDLPPLMILCWRTHLVITRHPEDGHGIAKMDNTTTSLITFYEEALPIRSEHCQNTKFSRSRHWKWSQLADDLQPSPEKNQQAKTHKYPVWPRKAESSQRVGNLPCYDRREVCTSHHHKPTKRQT